MCPSIVAAISLNLGDVLERKALLSASINVRAISPFVMSPITLSDSVIGWVTASLLPMMLQASLIVISLGTPGVCLISISLT